MLRAILVLGVLAISTGCEDKPHRKHYQAPAAVTVIPTAAPSEADRNREWCEKRHSYIALHIGPESELALECCIAAKDEVASAGMSKEWDRQARSYLYDLLPNREGNKEYKIARGELSELRFAWYECRGDKELYERIKSENTRMRKLMRAQK